MAGGRPTKYKPEYCEQLTRYFNKRVIRERKEVIEGAKWSRETIVREAVFFPSIEGFAAKIGVSKDTIYEWAKVHPKFSDAVKRASTKQHSLVYEHGMTGNLDSRLAGLFAQTNMGWRQRVDDEGEKTVIIKHEDMASERD